MNALGFDVTIPSLSLLTSVGVNQYQVVVKLFNSSGAPLSSPYVANTHTVTVTTTSTTFQVKIPVSDADYTLSNFTMRVYANNATNCCFAEETGITKTNTTEEEENELELGGYFSSN